MKFFFQKIAFISIFLSILTGFGILAYYVGQYNSNEAYLSSIILNKDNKIEKALFSPDDNIKDILMALIENEKEKISMAIFSLTHKEISEAIKSAHSKGIRVECITDKGYSNDKFSKINTFVDLNIPVWVYGKKDFFFNDSLMHNKFIIFKKNLSDKSILWTGSFNFTNRASKSNQENVIILESPDIIENYRKQFDVIKTRCALVSGSENYINKTKAKSENNNFVNVLASWKKYILGY